MNYGKDGNGDIKEREKMPEEIRKITEDFINRDCIDENYQQMHERKRELFKLNGKYLTKLKPFTLKKTEA